MIVGGVDIPDNKKGYISLSYIYGIGESLAKKILDRCCIDPYKKVCEWTKEDISKVITYIDNNCVIESELKGRISEDIKILELIGCYRGLRHKKSLPVRGQNTRTNARTRKGKKKPVANKKKVDK